MKTELVKIGGEKNPQKLTARNLDAMIMGLYDPKLVFERAAKLIRYGELVAFPTETVYGLGANALDAQAVAQIFVAKGRPSDNPLIVHIAKLDDLERVAEVSEQARQVAEHFWPGPLTLVLPKKACIPDIVTAGLPTVAVRMPNHPVAQGLIKAAGVPIAAPSANTSGRPSPTLANHVFDDLAGKIPLIIDDGPVKIGLESTVLDLSHGQPTILRPGMLGAEDLEAALGEVLGEVKYAASSADKPAAPGMKYKHYAPQAQVLLAEKEQLLATWEAHPEGMVLCFQDSGEALPPQVQSLILADEGDLAGYARQLFAAFRVADVMMTPLLIVETVPERGGLSRAIMNRLRKAAGLG